MYEQLTLPLIHNPKCDLKPKQKGRLISQEKHEYVDKKGRHRTMYITRLAKKS